MVEFAAFLIVSYFLLCILGAICAVMEECIFKPLRKLETKIGMTSFNLEKWPTLIIAYIRGQSA